MYYLKCIALVALMTAFVLNVIAKYRLSPVITLAVMAEKVRLMMKMYSFSRENLRKFNDEQKDPPLPSKGQFAYFLFAPTLIYKDSYPRAQSTDYLRVLAFLVQFLISIFIVFSCVRHLIQPAFRNVGLEPLSFTKLIAHTFQCFLIGKVFLMMLFYGFLHCYLNMWAELLKFGDRLFYKDWWNSTSFSHFLRTWNVVVHDFIYQYVYIDLVLLTNRSVATFGVIVTSALIHEYIIAVSIGFFYPVLMGQYVFLGGEFGRKIIRF